MTFRPEAISDNGTNMGKGVTKWQGVMFFGDVKILSTGFDYESSTQAIDAVFNITGHALGALVREANSK